MTADLSKQESKSVARPLRVLVPLIKADLQQGREASERAAMPYYQAAGEKMLEAKPQMTNAEFVPWLRRHFNIGYSMAQNYIKLADAVASKTTSPRGFDSLNAFRREHLGQQRPTHVYPQPWHEPIKQIIGRVDVDTLNLRKAEMARADEREAQRKLALQLIDIGFKALASKLHPDKGGSRDAMSRLNQVRERLRMHA